MAITTNLKKIDRGQLSATSDRAATPKSMSAKPRRTLHRQMLWSWTRPRRALLTGALPSTAPGRFRFFRSTRDGRDGAPAPLGRWREAWSRKCSMAQPDSRSCRAPTSRNRTGATSHCRMPRPRNRVRRRGGRRRPGHKPRSERPLLTCRSAAETPARSPARPVLPRRTSCNPGPDASPRSLRLFVSRPPARMAGSVAVLRALGVRE